MVLFLWQQFGLYGVFDKLGQPIRLYIKVLVILLYLFNILGIDAWLNPAIRFQNSISFLVNRYRKNYTLFNIHEYIIIIPVRYKKNCHKDFFSLLALIGSF